MSDPPKKKSRRARLAALIFFDLLFLYVMSYGPAFWLFTNGWLTGETAQVVYAPVDWVYEHSPHAVQKSMDSYVEMWAEQRPKPRRGRR